MEREKGRGREREREREKREREERERERTHPPIMAPVTMFVMLPVFVVALLFLCPGTLISNNLVCIIHLCKQGMYSIKH